MKKQPIIILLLLLSSNLQAQSNFFNAKRINIAEADAIESRFGSKTVKQKLKTVYANGADLAQPMVFRRLAFKDYGAATVYYTYSQKDSLVKDTSYYFNINEKNERPTAEKIGEYNTAFDKLVKLLSRDFGEPMPNQGKLTQYKETVIANSNTINNERTVEWNFEDYNIAATLIWTERNGELLMAHIKWKQ